MKLTAEQWQYVSIAALVVLGIGSLLYVTFVAAPRRRRLIEELAARELANIVEEVKPTPFGGLCIAMIIVTAVASFFMFADATTVFQQIQAGVAWIGGTIMFGIFAALSVTRTYTVYRSIHRQP